MTDDGRGGGWRGRLFSGVAGLPGSAVPLEKGVLGAQLTDVRRD